MPRRRHFWLRINTSIPLFCFAASLHCGSIHPSNDRCGVPGLCQLGVNLGPLAVLATMASRLESVPAELGLRIVEYIPRPSDLKALCLTSQTLRIPATTALYRRVTLRADVGGWRHQVNQVESGFLSPTNSGLHQIRELLLESEFNWPDEDENEAVEKVLMALPPNILRDL